MKHCWAVYEQNNIVNSVHVDDYRIERSLLVMIFRSEPRITDAPSPTITTYPRPGYMFFEKDSMSCVSSYRVDINVACRDVRLVKGMM